MTVHRPKFFIFLEMPPPLESAARGVSPLCPHAGTVSRAASVCAVATEAAIVISHFIHGTGCGTVALPSSLDGTVADETAVPSTQSRSRYR